MLRFSVIPEHSIQASASAQSVIGSRFLRPAQTTRLSRSLRPPSPRQAPRQSRGLLAWLDARTRSLRSKRRNEQRKGSTSVMGCRFPRPALYLDARTRPRRAKRRSRHRMRLDNRKSFSGELVMQGNFFETQAFCFGFYATSRHRIPRLSPRNSNLNAITANNGAAANCSGASRRVLSASGASATFGAVCVRATVGHAPRRASAVSELESLGVSARLP